MWHGNWCNGLALASIGEHFRRDMATDVGKKVTAQSRLQWFQAEGEPQLVCFLDAEAVALAF